MKRLPRQNSQRLRAWRQEMKNHLYTSVGTVAFTVAEPGQLQTMSVLDVLSDLLSRKSA